MDSNFNSLNSLPGLRVLTKHSSDEYDYKIVRDTLHGTAGVTIVLCQMSSQKQKRFFIAGDGGVDYLYKHMDSLTDTLCEQWFKEGQHRSKEKNVRS